MPAGRDDPKEAYAHMRNILLFLSRYFNLIVFLLLQVVSLSMLFSYNRLHETVFAGVMNEFAGSINSRFNSVQTYLSLRRQNEELREQNARLLNQLRADFTMPDTTFLRVTDSLSADSLGRHRRFLYMPAKVIGNSVHAQKNYVMLHRGSAQGVEANMAVVSPEGIVGTVVSVSANMSVVMSLLHKQAGLVAVMKKGGGFGEVHWDGKDPRFVTLSKVPKTVAVKKGDTVVTSQYSDRYPPGQLIGFVEGISDDPAFATYQLKVRTAVRFTELQHAFVVRNLLLPEMEALRAGIKDVDE